MLRQVIPELSKDFEAFIPGLVYAVCASDEFRGERPSRFFPFVRHADESRIYWSGQRIPVECDQVDYQLAQCAHAVVLYLNGVAERKIAYCTNVGSGAVHRLAIDASWVMDGLHKLSCVSELNCPQTVSNHFSLLSRRIRWGAPVEAIDIIRLAERNRVPGLGRQRAMALVEQGIKTIHDVLATTKQQLGQLLRHDLRTEALISAASNIAGLGPSRPWKNPRI